MSFVLSKEMLDFVWSLDLTKDQLKQFVDIARRDAETFMPPRDTTVGVNEERERLRNASTYAERKRAKDRDRQRRLREEERAQREQSRDIATTSRDIATTSTATQGDEDGDTSDEPATPRARVVYTSLPSLRSEEVITPISPKGEMSPHKPKPNGFARFWEAYPNKVGKQAAEKAYARALKRIPGHDPPGRMLAAVERAKRSSQWLRGYIPHPTTWLNEGRWDDEPAEIIPIRPENDPRPDPKRIAREANLARADIASQSVPRGGGLR